MQDSHYSILFVDDEAKTRKMFERLVKPSFKVISAEDVVQAKQILKDQGEEIGVLITDQRMPGELGVDLLRHVRSEYPAIIRLLTTAYSDLDDAIEAVNTGEIFRYINKPWNVDELLIDLRLAMNFFELEQDKSALIAEKISLSRRQYRTEILRAIIALGNAQADFSFSDHAIFALLSQLSSVDFDTSSNQDVESLGNFWGGEVNKTLKITNIAEHVDDALQKMQNLEGKLTLNRIFRLIVRRLVAI